MSNQSGVMFYFSDFTTARNILTDDQMGKIFRAGLEFAEFGVVPDFEDDKLLQLVWGPLEGKITRDFASYEKRVRKSKWGVYKRVCESKNEHPLGFEEWEATIMSPSSPMNTPASPTMEAQLNVDVPVAETVDAVVGVEEESRGSVRETREGDDTFRTEKRRQENIQRLLNYED